MSDSVNKIKYSRKFFRAAISRSVGGNVLIFVLLSILAIFTALPLYLAIINSIKPLNELWIFPPRFFVARPSLSNFRDLFSMMSNSTVPFSRYIFNTVFITVCGTTGQVIFVSMCAYPLAKHKAPGSQIFFRIIVLSLMFSTSVTVIPNYLTMARLDWIDTYLAIIVPIFGGSLGLYLMKQFMEKIPDSLIEASKIDGASEWRIFWTIVMPQVKPAWLTLIVFSVQSLWNTGQTNMIYNESLKTLNYALSQIIASGIARAGVATAVIVLMMSVPIIVFVVTQNKVIETMSSSGIKE